MKLSRLLVCAAIFSTIHVARAETSSASITLKLVDEGGAPLAGAEVTPVLKSKPLVYYKTKVTDAAGGVVFAPADYIYPKVAKIPEGTYTVLVHALGKSTFMHEVVLPTTGTVTIAAKPTAPLQLEVQTPEGKPAQSSLKASVFPVPFIPAMHWGADDDNKVASAVKPSGKGRYQLHLDTSTTTPWVLSLSAPGIVSSYMVELQTTAAKEGVLPPVKLPRTGHARVSIGIPEQYAAGAGDMLSTMSALKLVNLGDEERVYMNAGRGSGKLEGTTLTAELRDLPEGDYWVQGQAAPGQMTDSKVFSKGASLQIKTDETTSVEFTYKQFDPSTMRGAGVAHLRVKKLDGTPAAGLKYVVRHMDRDFGYQTFTTGTLDQDGRATVRDLATSGSAMRDGKTTAPAFVISDWKDQVGDNYYGGVRLGRIQFDTAGTSRTFEFTMAPREGDKAPAISLIDPYTSKTVMLSNFRGQVVFLDFWATWCGPCQAPMAHNQKVLTEKGAAWDGKAAIIGASIDDDAETLVKHVKQHGWEKVRHLWCGGDFSSGPSKTYGVDGVPTAFLIDQQGTIVWRGHPSGYELESEVEKLLKK